jgi:hypothetical protein
MDSLSLEYDVYKSTDIILMINKLLIFIHLILVFLFESCFLLHRFHVF